MEPRIPSAPLWNRLLSLIATSVLLGACSSTRTQSPEVGVIYPPSSTETVTVLSRTPEQVSGSDGQIGGQIGSIAGGYSGGLLGSLIGGFIGPALEKTVAKKSVSRYILQKGGGQTVTLLQDDMKSPLPPGTTAVLVRDPQRGTTRLVRSPS